MCLEFNNAEELIVFFVSLTGVYIEYTCPPNMTWTDFVNSEYNTGYYALSISGNLVMWASFAIDGQNPSSIIENGVYYQTYYYD